MRKIIYDSKRRLLIDEVDYRRTKKMSINEGKMLLLLSDNKIHTYDDIEEFIYGGISRYEKEDKNGIKINVRTQVSRLATFISRLKRRIFNFKELKILNQTGIGYYMKGDIWLE